MAGDAWQDIQDGLQQVQAEAQRRNTLDILSSNPTSTILAKTETDEGMTQVQYMAQLELLIGAK